jgi:hypothetical protein
VVARQFENVRLRGEDVAAFNYRRRPARTRTA